MSRSPFETTVNFLRWTGVFPLTQASSSGRLTYSPIWQIWSCFVSGFVLVSITFRAYIYHKLNRPYYKEEFLLQTVGYLEPIFSFTFVFSITLTNCISSNIKKQVIFVNDLFKISSLRTNNHEQISLLLKTMFPVTFLVIIVFVRYFFMVKELSFIQTQDFVFKLIFSYFIACQRAKFLFLLKLIQFELEYVCSELRSYKIVNSFEKIIKIWQRFEKIFRITIRTFILFTLMTFIMGIRAVYQVIVSLAYEKIIKIDTLIAAYWYVSSFPIVIWIVCTGEKIENEVCFCVNLPSKM